MTRQMPPQEVRPRHIFSIPPIFRVKWPKSLVLNILIAGAIGFLYVFLLLGLERIDPTNLSWLGGDAATYYIGWELFRQDPGLHWPVTFTERLGYPLGDSIAFMDPMPLIATLLKPFSPLLPTQFQYLGLAAVLAAALQFFFAAQLFRLLLGCHFFRILLPGLFFLISPPMTWRLVGHYALANHWLIVAALCLFVSLQNTTGNKSGRFLLFSGLLGGVAIGINVYLAFMVMGLVSAGVVTALWRRRMSLKVAGGVFAAASLACLLGGIAFGLIRSDGGYASPGYREFSLNLLAPIDPGAFGGLFLRSMLPTPYRTYEGYNYLGAGVLLVMIMLVPSISFQGQRKPTSAEVVPLACVCLFLAALAISTRVSIGSVVIADIDPREILTKYLSVFRASARFFWVPYYVALTAILAAAFRLWRPGQAVALISAALLIQFVDTVPLRTAVRMEVSRPLPQPLHSPVWALLGNDHANLLVLPASQCGSDTPGGPDGYRIFGMQAVSQHLRTNSYYAARYSAASLAFHCNQAIVDVMRAPLAGDSVYVVSPSVARTIAAGPTGPNACHTLDGFILCSIKTDFGLGSSSPIEPEVPLMYATGHIDSWRDAMEKGYFTGDWHDAEPEGIWSKGHGTLQFRLSPEQRSRYRAASLKLMVPVGARGVQYRIQSGNREQSGTFHGSSRARAEVFEVRVPLQHFPDSIERIVLITQDAIRPVDIGMNSDGRLLGLAVLGVTLVP